MRFLSTLFLFFLTLALGAYIFFYEQNTLSTDKIKDSTIYLFDVDFAEVKHFSVKDSTSGKTIKMEKDRDDRWFVTEPAYLLADQTRVSTVLSKLCFLGIFRKLDYRKEYGVDTYTKEISFSTDTQTYKLYVGNLAPLDDNQYVKKEGDDYVYSVSASVLQGFEADINIYRNRLLFNLTFRDLKDILVSYQQKVLRFAADDDFTWKMADPVSAKIQQPIMHAILAELEKITIEAFVDDISSYEEYGLKEPLGRMVLTDKSGAFEEVLLGKTDGDFIYIKVEGFDFVGKISKTAILKYLKADVNIYRDKRFLSLYPFEVQGVEVKNEKGVTALYKEKIENDVFWYVKDAEANIFEIDINNVRKYFDFLRTLDIADFLVNNPDSETEKLYEVSQNHYLKIKTDSRELLFNKGKIDIEKDLMCVKIASENSLVNFDIKAKKLFAGFSDDFFSKLNIKRRSVSE